MTDPAPSATVDGRAATRTLSRPRPYAVAALAGAVVGAVVYVAGPASLVTTFGETGSAVASTVVAALVVLGTRLALASHRTTDEVRFYGNGLAIETGAGPLGTTGRVAYEDVDLVVRRRDGTHVEYELIRSGAPSVTLRGLRDTETVAELLGERVPSPTERNEELLEDAEKSMEERLAERGVVVPGAEEADEAPPRPIADERVFWRCWPRSETLPESPVVEGSALPGSLGPMNRRTPDLPERQEEPRTIGSGEHTVEEIAAGEVGRTNADETPWTWAAREDNKLGRNGDDRR